MTKKIPIDLIITLVEKHGMGKAAELLDTDRVTIWRKLRKNNLGYKRVLQPINNEQEPAPTPAERG